MKEWRETQISILAADTGSGLGGRGSGGQKERGEREEKRHDRDTNTHTQVEWGKRGIPG